MFSDSTVTEAKYHYLDMQWKLTEKLIETLWPLQIATSVEFNVSCSCVIPVLFGLIQLLEVSETSASTLSIFKQLLKLTHSLKRYAQHLTSINHLRDEETRCGLSLQDLHRSRFYNFERR